MLRGKPPATSPFGFSERAHVMPRLFHRPPKYCLHKSTQQAVVSLNGTRIYLGPYGSRRSHIRYQEVLKDWESQRDQQQRGSGSKRLNLSVPQSRLLHFAKNEGLAARRQSMNWCLCIASTLMNTTERTANSLERQRSLTMLYATCECTTQPHFCMSLGQSHSMNSGRE